MKKFLIALLSAVAGFSLALAVGCSCNDDPEPVNTYTVEFKAAEGITYFGELLGSEAVAQTTITVESNTVVSFGVNYSEEYDLEVKADDVVLSENNGNYAFTVRNNTVVTVSSRPHSMSGSGTSADPFIVSRAYDLRYIADKVAERVPNYVYGYYELKNDIDVNGGELKVIGDGTIVNGSASTFVGFFDGKGHTISNYVINSENSSQVGLFGYVTVTGNDDGAGIIRNLNIDNFTVNANIPKDSGASFVGSFVGVGVATNLVACNATNGNINVFAGSGSTVFAGGAAGSLQSYTLQGGSTVSYLYSVADYVTTSVNIEVGSGILYAAGGVVGYLYADSPRATSSVVNCYSEGDVFGAQRSGGIVAVLSDYTSIANCYSTSVIFGYCDSISADPLYGAFAGGLVGYAFNDTVISDSFFYGSVDANVANQAVKTVNSICAGYDPADYVTEQLVIFNCYSENQVNLNDEFFKALGWKSCDWVLKAGELPVINQEAVESDEFAITYNFGNEKIALNNGNLVSSYSYTLEVGDNYYVPFCYYVDAKYIDDGFFSEAKHTSYGFYFDKELTQKVPNSYIPTRAITFYVGFEDYSTVSGTYYMVTGNGKVATLSLNNTGSYEFTCGVQFPVSAGNALYPSMKYTYDGEKIIFSEGLFARLSSVTDKTAPQYNYEPYDFRATFTDGALTIIGGTAIINGEEVVFFTEDAPLVAVKTEPAATHDAFYGVWEKSATISKKYTFNDGGAWSYSYGANNLSGTYSVNGEGIALLSLNGESYASAKINGGILEVTVDGQTSPETFVYENSRLGTWYDPVTQATIYLDGYGTDYAGAAICYLNGVGYELYYVVDGYFDNNGKTAVTLLSAYSLFGYLYLDSDDTLVGSLFDTSSVSLKDGFKFYLVDDYSGEWVGEDGEDFIILDFNGNGLYNVEGGENKAEVKGYLTVNGEKVAYSCTRTDGLAGKFIYNNVEYKFVYDDVNNIVKVTGANGTVNYQRKDEWAGYTLVDSYENVYSFNGGGNLDIGGLLTITSKTGETVGTLSYKVTGSGILDKLNKSGNNADVYLTLKENGTEVGSIKIRSFKFEFKYDGANAGIRALNGGRLTLDNPFYGTWAVGGRGSNFEVGTIDLTFKTSGKFMDMDTTTYVYDIASNSITFDYLSKESDAMSSPVTFYLLYLSDGNIAISPYSNQNSDMLYCTHPDKLYGPWVNTVTGTEFVFDGNSSSRYIVGIARDMKNVVDYAYTFRFGKYFIWQPVGEGEKETYFEIVDGELNQTGENVYVQGKKVIVWNEFDDSTPVVSATGKDGTVYKIYLDGRVKVGDVDAEYLIDILGDGKTVIRIDYGNEVYQMVEIDYTDADNVIAAVIDG